MSFNRNQDDLLKVQNMLRRFDHISIYLMIAGSYTPLCTCALDQSNARPLLIFVWALALAGVIQKVCLAFSPRWSTVATYLFMGWVSVSMWNPLNRLYAMKDLMWLIMGGVLYSIGAVIYASKIPDFAPDIVGFHGLWHVFVLLAGVFGRVRGILCCGMLGKCARDRCMFTSSVRAGMRGSLY